MGRDRFKDGTWIVVLIVVLLVALVSDGSFDRTIQEMRFALGLQ